MNNYLIITNNPRVQSSYPFENVIFTESYIEVLTIARDNVHKGAKLLSHPEASSIKPYETPYRSVVISKAITDLDFDSLKYIENAMQRYQSLVQSMGKRDYGGDERILKDFQVIDADLIKSAMQSLRIVS